MGWRNQHDFKIVFGVAAIALLSSCSLFYNYDKVADSKDTKVIKVKNPGKVYLVNWNREYDYLENESISVSNIKEREAEQGPLLPTLTAAPLTDAEYAKAKLDQENRETFRNLLAKSPRVAAGRNMSIRQNTATVGQTKSFWIYDLETTTGGAYRNKYKQETFTCKYVGEHCIVWYLPKTGISISNKDCQDLGNKFDSIYEMEENLIGTHKYESCIYNNVISSQEKIDLIFYDIQDDNDNGYILGYEYPTDFIVQSTLSSKSGYDAYSPHSNETQGIYLDTYFYKVSPEILFSTLAHEFNHLLNTSQKEIMKGMECSLWYTEMLSMLTEDCFQEYLGVDFRYSPKKRLQKYIRDYGYSASPFDWFDINSDYAGYSYASTYALGCYLARNYGGIELIHEIATNDYVDETSVANALAKLGYHRDGYDKIESFWETVYDEPYILINTQAKSKEKKDKVNKDEKNKYITLNRGWTSDKFDGLSLTPIEIGKPVQVDGGKLKFDPVFMQIDEDYTGGNYYKAFTIFEIGEKIKEFKVETTEDYKGVYNVYYPQPVK